MSESKSITLYKRDAKGKPIFWKAEIVGHKIILNYGIVGKTGYKSEYTPPRGVEKEWKTIVANKRREGGKEIIELWDNSPENIVALDDLYHYLDTYLPKYNETNNGFTLPQLAKIYEFNNEQNLLGQVKINGERCKVHAIMRGDGFFQQKGLIFFSRKGLEYKCPTLERYLLDVIISDKFFMRMLEEGIALDGELYIPNCDVNEILSAARNLQNPLNPRLQYWNYDLVLEDMPQAQRIATLYSEFAKYKQINSISANALRSNHLNNRSRFVLVNTFTNINGDDDIIKYRDIFVSAGFEGGIYRNPDSVYQFGKRNSAMYKCKPLLDGKFTILDIIPEGAKRPEFSKFILRNDINEETFECMPTGTAERRKEYLTNKDEYIGKYAFVEYRGRSGVKDAPFHGNVIRVIQD